MRALLPISGKDNRSSIHAYEGFSQVFDARVVCVRPNITNLEVLLSSSNSWNHKSPSIMRGNMSIPSDLEEIAAASHVYGNDWNEFSCQISIANLEAFQAYPPGWKMTVCQFDRGAGNLQDVFTKVDASKPLYWNKIFQRNSYLLMNFTGNVSSPTSVAPEFADDQDPIANPAFLGRIFNDSIPGLIRKSRADWVDIYRNEGDYTPNEMGLRLSFSLCFSAFRAQPFNISASSSVPLVEPTYRYDSENGRVKFDDFRKQMLKSSGSFEDRGILSLAVQNWSARTTKWDGFYPYFHWMGVESLLSIENTGGAPTVHLAESMIPSSARADVSIGGLLLDMLYSGGTTAEAVQSMLTAILQSRYQDYFFSKGGIEIEHGSSFSTRRADFVAVQVPGGQGRLANRAAGATKSYLLK